MYALEATFAFFTHTQTLSAIAFFAPSNKTHTNHIRQEITFRASCFEHSTIPPPKKDEIRAYEKTTQQIKITNIERNCHKKMIITTITWIEKEKVHG